MTNPLVSICNNVFPYLSYFSFQSSDSYASKKTDLENSTPEDLEKGLGKSLEPAPGSVPIVAKEVSALAKNSLVEPNKILGGAVENPSDFYPKFNSLLYVKYQDRGDKTIRVIGEAALEIAAKADPKTGVFSIADIQTIQDLELLVSDSTKTSLISKMDPCLTKMGSAHFTLGITRPTCDFTVIQRRQNLLHALRSDPTLCEALESDLHKIAFGEIYLLSTRDTEKQTPGAITKSFYAFRPSINAYLNNSPALLDARVALQTTMKVSTTVGQGLATGALACVPIDLYHAIRSTASSEWTRYMQTNWIGHGGLGFVGQMLSNANSRWIRLFATVVIGGWAACNVENTKDWLVADTSMLELLRKILLPISDYYKGAQAMYARLKDRPDIICHLEHFSKLEKFFSPENQVGELGQFTSAMSSGLYRPGHILLAWSLLHPGGGKKGKDKEGPKEPATGDALRKQIDDLFIAMGEIDCFASIALQMQRSEGSDKPICAPQFVLDDMPLLHAEEMYHPGVPSDKEAVTNTLKLGKDAPSHSAIITGANGCGKSGALEATTLLPITATMGFCYAKNVVMTPFTFVRTSAKICGSMVNATSSFEQQCKRGGVIMQDISSIESSFGLVAFDEPCRETDAENAAIIVENMTDTMAKNPRILSIINTHLIELAGKIGDKENSQGQIEYKNYHVEDGLEKYHLLDGVAPITNAVQLAKESGLMKK